MTSMTPLFDSLNDDQRKQILAHVDEVMKANERVNLTRIDTWEDGIILHVEDSLSALPEINDAPAGHYADMGSGAGFPGIPLSIATGRQTLLIDARKKKMDEVQSIIETMGLSDQISTYAGRAELLARKEPAKYSVITARALAKISVLLELASPLLNKGGRLICFKANVEDDEMKNAERVAGMVGMKLISDRSFMLNDEYSRRIIVFEKRGASKVKLPRQEGQAQKNPL